MLSKKSSLSLETWKKFTNSTSERLFIGKIYSQFYHFRNLLIENFGTLKTVVSRKPKNPGREQVRILTSGFYSTEI